MFENLIQQINQQMINSSAANFTSITKDKLTQERKTAGASPVSATPKGVRLAPSSNFIQPSVVHKKVEPHINQSLEEQLVIDDTQNIEMCEVFVIIGANDDMVQRAVSESEANINTENEFNSAGLDVFVSGGDSQESSFLMVEGHKRPSLVRNIAHTIKSQASILDTYPSIYKEDHKQVTPSTNDILNPMASKIKEQYLYLSNIQLICFPDGYALDTDFQTQKLQPRKQLYKIMHYTITQSSGEKKFLTCLEYKDVTTFTIEKERYNEENGTTQLQIRQYTVFVPKSLCLVSRVPIFALQRQILELIFNDLVKPYYQSLLEKFDPKDPEESLKQAKQKVPIDLIEFYVSTFLHHIRFNSSHLELEIYREQGSKIESLIKYVNAFERNYGSLRIENYDYRMLFQRVKPHMLMQIFVCLLHERKVILILGGGGGSNSEGLNSADDCMRNGAIIIETLLSLLYPLQWNFTNISNLIPSMIDYLEAPFPYIVCVSRELWRNIYEHRWNAELCQAGDEVVAFDLDTQRVHIRGHNAPSNIEEFMPEFPQPYTQLVIQQLEKQLQKASEFTSQTQNDSVEQQIFWKQFTLKVKQQFLNFLIFLINTFENFYNPGALQQHENQNSGEITHSSNETAYKQGNSANDIFNFQDYVQNVKENQSFFERFVRTQGFINFIEQAHSSLLSLPSQDAPRASQQQEQISEPHLTFFKACTRKLSQENIQAVRQMQDQIITTLLARQQNQVRYSLDKCRVIYEAAMRGNREQRNSNNDKSYQVITSLRKERIINFGEFEMAANKGNFSRFNEGIASQSSAQKAVKSQQSSSMEIKYTANKEQQYFSQQRPIMERIGSSSNPPQQRQLIKIEDNMDVETSEQRSERNNRSLDDKLQSQPKRQQNVSHLLRPTFPLHLNASSKVVYEANAEDEIDRSQSASQNPAIQQQQHDLNQSMNSYTQNHDLSSLPLPIQLDDQSSNDEEEGESNQQNKEDQDNEGGASIINFFKKTFSSVKKTFESTFKNQDKRRSQSKLAGRRTPLVAFNEREDGDNQSPLNKQQRVKYPNGYQSTSKIVNRTQRSQTFHETKNQNIEKQEQESFFANLFGIGSAQKEKLNSPEGLVSGPPPTRNNRYHHYSGLPMDPLIVSQKTNKDIMNSTAAVNLRHKMNNSGFFVFDEEDMKRMTEMSPRELTHRAGGQQNPKASSNPFNFDIEVPTTSGVIPQIKGQTIFKNNEANRLRSISYQNPALRIMAQDRQKLVEDSLELIDKYPIVINQKQTTGNIKSPFITDPRLQLSSEGQQLGTKSETRKNQIILPSPNTSKELINNRLMTGSQSQNSLMNKQKQLFPSHKISNQLSLIKEDPTNLSNGGNESSAQASPARKLKNEFEEVYRKSTENLFFLQNNNPAAQNNDPERKSKKKFNLWKNNTGKVELYSREKIQPPQSVFANNQSKPPKHQQQQVNKKRLTNNKGNNRSSTLIQNDKNYSSDEGPNDNQQERISATLLKNMEQQSKRNVVGVASRTNNLMNNENSNVKIHEHTHSQSISNLKQIYKQQIMNHRRQVSYQGTQSYSNQITGPMASTAQQVMTLENIEPDEDEDSIGGDHLLFDQDKTQNIMLNQQQISLPPPQQQKQIESMQVGRVKQRTSNVAKQTKKNNSQTVNSNVLGLKQLWKMEFPQANTQMGGNTQNTGVKTSTSVNFKLAFNQHASGSKNLIQPPSYVHKKQSMKKIFSSKQEINGEIDNDKRINTYRDDEEEEKKVESIKQNYKHIQAKTVESNSSSSNELDEEAMQQKSIAYRPQMMIMENANKTQKYQISNKVDPHPLNPSSPQTKINISTQQEDYTGGHSSGQRRHPPFLDNSNKQQQAPQLRLHSLSSYYPSNSVIYQGGNNGGASSVIATAANTMKPLNKITWDSFSQIAKLTGDVDHEPSTPKSGGCDINFPEDDEDSL